MNTVTSAHIHDQAHDEWLMRRAGRLQTHICQCQLCAWKYVNSCRLMLFQVTVRTYDLTCLADRVLVLLSVSYAHLHNVQQASQGLGHQCVIH